MSFEAKYFFSIRYVTVDDDFGRGFANTISKIFLLIFWDEPLKHFFFVFVGDARAQLGMNKMRFANSIAFGIYSQCTTIDDFATEWSTVSQLYQLEK